MAPTPAYRLVSSGKTLTVISCEAERSGKSGYNVIHEYTPANRQPVLGSSWSADSACIASSVRNSDKIVLTYSKKNIYTSAEISTTIEKPSIVLFPRYDRTSVSQKRGIFANGMQVCGECDAFKQLLCFFATQSILAECISIFHCLQTFHE